MLPCIRKKLLVEHGVPVTQLNSIEQAKWLSVYLSSGKMLTFVTKLSQKINLFFQKIDILLFLLAFTQV